MTSIAILEAVNTSYVPFNGQQVLTAVAAGVTYVAMRQIVENIGIDWTGQSVKLRKMKDKFNCRDISMVATDGKLRKLLCLPLKKLNGWLFSINPEKVRADIRDKLIQYQEECFTVLHDYWTKGEVTNPRKSDDKTSTDDRTPLRGLVNRIMGKTGIHYQPLYKMIHREFGVNHIDELTPKQVAEAVEYLAGKVLEGEFLGKQEELPAPKMEIDFPVEWWNQFDYLLSEHRVNKFQKDKAGEFPARMLFGDSADAPSAINRVLTALDTAGYDVGGARIELQAYRGYMKSMYHKLSRISELSTSILGSNITVSAFK